MLVVEEFVGRLDEEAVAARVESGDPLYVAVDGTERRRSRFRTTAEDGTELGVVVARELCDGDVLATEDRRLVVVSLEAVEAMVLEFDGHADPDRAAVTTALELGHAVGNRHWDLAVEEGRAYFPLADSRDRMEATVEPHLPDGVAVEYDEVPPTLFDEDGSAAHSHSHGDGGHSHGPDPHGPDSHSHGPDSHSHGPDSHSHGTDGHSHDHGVRTLDPKPGDTSGGGES